MSDWKLQIAKELTLAAIQHMSFKKLQSNASFETISEANDHIASEITKMFSSICAVVQEESGN